MQSRRGESRVGRRSRTFHNLINISRIASVPGRFGIRDKPVLRFGGREMLCRIEWF